MTKILSIDGGGIRGIIPAVILYEIEERTGKPISELFDLIAGTSTGGILALGLTKPDSNQKPQYTAEELIDLYTNEGGEIFSRSVWHRIRAGNDLIEEKYPSEGVETVLQRYFGGTHLKEALTDVFIPSYEIEQRTPWFFRSYAKDPKNEGEYDFFMKDVARATSAAPTYFEPAKLDSAGPQGYYALIDGGVFANNPAMCAYVEARHVYKEENDILVVSLGTGQVTDRLAYERAKDWGIAQWAQPILNVVFDGVSHTVDFQLEELLNNASNDRRYYRFQTLLDKAEDALDDAGADNIQALKVVARELIEEQEEDLKDLCKQLS